MHFDYIIILSAAAKDAEGNFPDFLKGMYLGSGVRVNAALKLVVEYPKSRFIVVGGYNEKNVGIMGTSKKVDDIVHFLKASNRAAMIQEIYSLPCTHHNFVAVFNYWKRNKISPATVGVLSNGYHLPRAIAFANTTAEIILQENKITFVPLVAEDIDPLSVPKLNTATTRKAYAKRLKKEKEGLLKISSGSYADYCLTRDFPLLKDIIYENANYLLSESEKQTLKLK